MPQTPVNVNPPIRTPFFPQVGTDQSKWPAWFAALTWIFAYPWLSWFQFVGNQLNKVSLNAPLKSASPGRQGTIATDGVNLFLCVSANNWIKFGPGAPF